MGSPAADTSPALPKGLMDGMRAAAQSGQMQWVTGDHGRKLKRAVCRVWPHHEQMMIFVCRNQNARAREPM